MKGVFVVKKSKKRTYTICTNGSVGNWKIPTLKITGKWLQEYGFNIGDKLLVLESKNMLILCKI